MVMMMILLMMGDPLEACHTVPTSEKLTRPDVPAKAPDPIDGRFGMPYAHIEINDVDSVPNHCLGSHLFLASRANGVIGQEYSWTRSCSMNH